MFKKFLSVLFLSLFCCRLAAAAAVDQTDKTAVVKAAFTAVANNDYETLWLLLPPELKDAAVKDAGSESAAIKKFEQYRVSSEEGKELITNLANKEFLDSLTAAVADCMVCIDGKWYISVPDDEEIDLSTKELLVKQIMSAVILGDAELFWMLISPEERIGMVEKFGSIPAAVQEVAKLVKPLDPEEKAQAVKKIGQPEFINDCIRKFEPDMVLINKNWYLDPKLHHDSFDRSNKEKVLKTYLTALVASDADALWKTLDPFTRLKIVSETENGDIMSAKKELLAAFLQNIPTELIEIKDKINDPRLLQAMLLVHQDNFVQINGNWYLDLLSFHEKRK